MGPETVSMVGFVKLAETSHTVLGFASKFVALKVRKGFGVCFKKLIPTSFHGPMANALYQDSNLNYENSELSPMF